MKITINDTILNKFSTQLQIMIGVGKIFIERINGIPEIKDQEQLDILKMQISKVEANLKSNFNIYYWINHDLITYNYISSN